MTKAIIKNSSLSILLLFSFVLTSCLDNSTDSDRDQNNLREQVQSIEIFDTFADLISGTELDSAIAHTGPYTLLIPTDEAFSKLPEGTMESLSEEELTEVLSYHIINGIINLNNFTATVNIESSQGEDIYFNLTQDSVYVNNNRLTGSAAASNGVIYSKTGVSFPDTYLNTAGLISKRFQLNILDSLITQTDLATRLEDSSEEFTVFAPADSVLDDAALPDDQQELLNVLEYHVVPQKFLTGDFSSSQTLETLNGQEITVAVDGNVITVNGSAAVTTADIEGTNGVVHIIDELLENTSE